MVYIILINKIIYNDLIINGYLKYINDLRG